MDRTVGIASCPIDFVSLETPPPTPPSIQNDTKSPRRSSRLAHHSRNLSYTREQGRYRRAKRQRLGSDEPAINESANCEPVCEPANCEPANCEPANCEPTNCEPANCEPAVDYTVTEPPQLTNGQQIDADTNKPAYDDGMDILDEYYRDSPVDTLSVSWNKSAHQPCSPSTNHPGTSEALTHQNPSKDSLDK